MFTASARSSKSPAMARSTCSPAGVRAMIQVFSIAAGFPPVRRPGRSQAADHVPHDPVQMMVTSMIENAARRVSCGSPLRVADRDRIDFHGIQMLTELVVKFASDPATLVFLHLHMRCASGAGCSKCGSELAFDRLRRRISACASRIRLQANHVIPVAKTRECQGIRRAGTFPLARPRLDGFAHLKYMLISAAATVIATRKRDHVASTPRRCARLISSLPYRCFKRFPATRQPALSHIGKISQPAPGTDEEALGERHADLPFDAPRQRSACCGCQRRRRLRVLLLLGLCRLGSSAAAEQQSVPVLAPVEVIAPTRFPTWGFRSSRSPPMFRPHRKGNRAT